MDKDVGGMYVCVCVCESCSVMSNSMWPHGLYSLWNSPGQNTGVGSLSLPLGILPTKGLNPSLPHWRQILYQLSHKGSPRILEWVAYPLSSRSSQPRNQTGVSCIAGRFLTNWAIREAPIIYTEGFPGGSEVRVCPQCGIPGFDPWVGRSPREGNGNPLHYSCLGNPMDREAWQSTVYGSARELDTA